MPPQVPPNPSQQMERFATTARRAMQIAMKTVSSMLYQMESTFKQCEKDAEYNRQLALGEIVFVKGCPCPIYIGPEAAKAERARKRRARKVSRRPVRGRTHPV
jgi:hypothetical protein